MDLGNLVNENPEQESAIKLPPFSSVQIEIHKSIKK